MSSKIDWFETILMAIVVISMGFILIANTSNMTPEFKEAMLMLIVAILPLIIIMSVLMYAMKKFMRVKF